MRASLTFGECCDDLAHTSSRLAGSRFLHAHSSQPCKGNEVRGNAKAPPRGAGRREAAVCWTTEKLGVRRGPGSQVKNNDASGSPNNTQ